MNDAIVDLVVSMLLDDHGMSEHTYTLLGEISKPDNDLGSKISLIMSKVDATDGRFYLNELP